MKSGSQPIMPQLYVNIKNLHKFSDLYNFFFLEIDQNCPHNLKYNAQLPVPHIHFSLGVSRPGVYS